MPYFLNTHHYNSLCHASILNLPYRTWAFPTDFGSINNGHLKNCY